ncbi:MAG: CcmL [Hyphomicrobiales bacterium]|nr:CcmL [Hyphomicrobiales bacterium]
MRFGLAIVVAALLSLMPVAAYAVNPNEMLADPALESRAKDISQGLRCLVCQNESIEESDADLAHDLRVLVRDRVKAGDTNQQATQYIVDRYGEFVLLKPVMALHTILLWFAAPGVLLIGLVVVILAARKRRAALPPTLTPEEAAALASLEESGVQK